jgi:regulator of cell morphogenesis and NO signaling
MENQLTSKTLAQIVSENHEAATVFEKHGLDFCCKGKRSLQTACEEKNLSVQVIAGELETVLTSVDPTSDYKQFGLSQLVDHIVHTHHAYVKQQMPQIFAWLQKVASKHGTRHPELFEVFESFDALQQEMIMHMRKEELVLFPYIGQLEQGKVDSGMMDIHSPIAMMEHEHAEAGEVLGKIRRLTNDYNPPADACTTYKVSFASLQAFELDLHQHIHLENNILFPKSIELYNKLILN